MASSFAVLSLLLAMAAPSLLSSEASTAPPRRPRGPATAAEFLSAINEARANVSVPPLSWNATLAQNAKAQMSWLRRSSGGRNLAQLGRSPVPQLPAVGMTTYQSSGRETPADAVRGWVSEQQWNSACAAAKDCRSYKLVVRRAWQQVGCAVVACASGGTLMACEYSPGTNRVPDPEELPY